MARSLQGPFQLRNVDMLSEPSAGPRLDNATTLWHSIDWRKCHRAVRKLQMRIAKAVREGRWRVVRRLQRLLTRSFSAKCLAVLRVTENRGRKTPGVDGETWNTPLSKTNAVSALGKRDYRPMPLRRIYIPKKSGKSKRPLSIPTLNDRAHQALHRFGLEPIAEALADRNSYGFRPARCTADAIEQCYILLARKDSPQWILEGDIKGCFDNIDKSWMEEHIPMDRKILKSWLDTGFIEQEALFPTPAGVPQGGIISPTISNMVLDGMERLLHEHFPPKGRRRQKVHLVRYADDFLVTGVSRETLEEGVMPLLKAFLAERGLELSAEKTQITHIQTGFDFLGQSLRKHGDKLVIEPSRASRRAFREKVRALLGRLKTAPQELVIGKLNPVIRGWANYHHHVMSKDIFYAMDSWLWRRLWRWCRRRHPNKNGHWIANRYFERVGSRRWVFRASKRVVKGKITWAPRPGNGKRPYPTLLSMGDTKIVRHVKVKQDANPYDPAWELYFEERLDRKMRRSLSWVPRTLWIRQGGQCPICSEKLSYERDWNVHHVLYRCHGGTSVLDNLQLLHANCHRQLHARDAAGQSPDRERLTEGLSR